jgi:hypothetical protein
VHVVEEGGGDQGGEREGVGDGRTGRDGLVLGSSQVEVDVGDGDGDGGAGGGAGLEAAVAGVGGGEVVPSRKLTVPETVPGVEEVTWAVRTMGLL